MKNKICLFFLIITLASLSFGNSSKAETPQFRIQVSSVSSKKALEEKVLMLERAVWELQNKVYALQAQQNQNQQAVVGPMVTCMLKTPFNGVFTATEASEMAAKAKAMKECAEKTSNSFHCDESNVKCGK